MNNSVDESEFVLCDCFNVIDNDATLYRFWATFLCTVSLHATTVIQNGGMFL